MIDKEKMYEALDLISAGVVQPTKIAKTLGMAYRTYRSWLVRSNNLDPLFELEIDGEVMQFAKAVALHTRLAALELRGQIIQESIHGYSTQTFMNGAPVWATCPIAAAMTEAERVALGFRADALKTGPKGELVPVMQWHPAPAAVRLRVLEAFYPKEFRPASTQEITVNGQVAIGVARATRTDFSRDPPAIPPEPPIPQLEVLGNVVPPDINDPELAEMLGPEPQPVPVAINIDVTLTDPPEYEPEPEPMTMVSPPLPPLPPREPVIRDTPTAAETPPPQTRVLAANNVPAGWRAEWERLQQRAALPDKLNRRA